uniref:Uncharacterized protein n=1 Tax=Borreliella burgdorferi TaxID=139 RepID=Q9ZIZ7_BORBG|nr:unknown [Borreliella burgdorferi N40]
MACTFASLKASPPLVTLEPVLRPVKASKSTPFPVASFFIFKILFFKSLEDDSRAAFVLSTNPILHATNRSKNKTITIEFSFPIFIFSSFY